jgi:hypothetical protein
MKLSNPKLLFLLPMLFAIDLFRPLGYALSVEFVFLGVIFASLNEDFLSALIIGAFAGLLCDFFNPGGRLLFTFEFIFIVCLSAYLASLFRFLDKNTHIFIAKGSLLVLALVIHTAFNSLFTGRALPFFWVKFIMQSAAIYPLIAYLLKKRSKENQPDATF